MKTARVFITDNHQLIVDALALQLARLGIEVVGTANNGKDLLDWLDTNTADILLLDIKMPVLDGFDVLRYFVENEIAQKTIIISEFTDRSNLATCIELGVHGFLSKSTSIEYLEIAIEKVLDGGKFFSPDLHEKIRQ